MSSLPLTHRMGMTALAGFAGLEVIVSKLLPEKTITWQFRFPRSRKRRIRRKWEKDRRNWKSRIEPVMYRMGNRLICNQVAYDQLQGELAKHGFRYERPTP